MNGKVIVTGCLGAKALKPCGGEGNSTDPGAPQNLVKHLHPSVLAVTGPQATQEVMDAVYQHCLKPNDPFLDSAPSALGEAGIRLTLRHYAYLKISEGCNYQYIFCIIPSMRGDLVSRPISDVLKEAWALFESGVKEFLIISQDTSAYGVDVKYCIGFWERRLVKARMLDLAQQLADLAEPYSAWVRMHCVYPYPHVDEMPLLTEQGRILPYLDVPLQYSYPDVLRRMKRPASDEKILSASHVDDKCIQSW